MKNTAAYEIKCCQHCPHNIGEDGDDSVPRYCIHEEREQIIKDVTKIQDFCNLMGSNDGSRILILRCCDECYYCAENTDKQNKNKRCFADGRLLDGYNNIPIPDRCIFRIKKL